MTKFSKARWSTLNPIPLETKDINLPWVRTWRMLDQRCRNAVGYKGIKNFITPFELQYLWFRDKAFSMNKPTIDRKNSKGDYILENCQYIEHVDNCAKTFYSEECRNRMSKRIQEQRKNSEFIKKREEGHRAYFKDPANLIKRAETSKKMWRNAELRKRMLRKKGEKNETTYLSRFGLV
jgi:hypothetical protein